MNASVSMGTRIRTSSPSWARLFVELSEPDESSIDVEWLAADETIVLETTGEAELV